MSDHEQTWATIVEQNTEKCGACRDGQLVPYEARVVKGLYRANYRDEATVLCRCDSCGMEMRKPLTFPGVYERTIER